MSIRIKNSPNQELIDECQTNVWDIGNQILYDLCSQHFEHKTDAVIRTKVIFIGRLYAAAVERRKNKTDEEINDDFYTSTIVPTFMQSRLDEYLAALKGFDRISSDNILKILRTHNYLLLLLKQITDLEKRSFCSKYLHFHLPDLFFIYDSRAVSALRLMISRVPKKYKPILTERNIDNEYTKFFLKCMEAKYALSTKFGVNLSNRQFDNLLMLLANDLQRKK